MKEGYSSTPNPAQQISSEISSLQTKIGWLQENVRLTKARDAVEDVQTSIHGMAQRIGALRTRGYVFEKDLEIQAQSFTTAWEELCPNIQTQINMQSNTLMNALRPVELQMPQLSSMASNPGAARGMLTRLQSAVDQIEGQVSAAERTISGMYDKFNSQVYAASRHLDEIDSMLNQLAEATFKLLPTEAGIAAVKAVWCKSGKEQKEDPEGVLFLTDQRLLFEQKEEIATKKVLFVVTEKKKVQNLLLESPVAVVDNITPSKEGLMKNEDHLDIRFGSGAPVQMAHFHIWQEGAAWQALVNRAKTKDFDQGRAVAVDATAVEKVKSAPSQCPSCGGNINTIVLRGMDTIKCEYCGYVIRL